MSDYYFCTLCSGLPLCALKPLTGFLKLWWRCHWCLGSPSILFWLSGTKCHSAPRLVGFISRSGWWACYSAACTQCTRLFPWQICLVCFRLFFNFIFSFVYWWLSKSIFVLHCFCLFFSSACINVAPLSKLQWYFDFNHFVAPSG